MGFYTTDERAAVLEPCQENLIPPSKNRVWNFFTTSETCTGFFESQPVESHQEKWPTPTKAVSGVRYYGHRHYEPTTGRWMSRDPMGEGGGNNIYQFAENNAAGNIDMLGLCIPGELREHTEDGSTSGGVFTGVSGVGYTSRQYGFMLEVNVQCGCEKKNVTIKYVRVKEACQCSTTEIVTTSGTMCCNGSYNWVVTDRINERRLATTRIPIWTHRKIITMPEHESETVIGACFDGIGDGFSICGDIFAFVREQTAQCSSDCMSRR